MKHEGGKKEKRRDNYEFRELLIPNSQLLKVMLLDVNFVVIALNIFGNKY